MLSLIVFLPLVGVLLITLLPKKFEAAAKWLALVTSVVDFGLVIALLTRFKIGSAAIQFEKEIAWIPQVHIYYHLGIDGLSLPLLALSTLLIAIATLASWKITVKPRLYFAMILLLSVGLSGVFLSLDLVLFYLFWEIVLIPMYFLISQWGGPRRQYAAIKFFLYTFFGSVFMLVGIAALFIYTGSFDMIALRHLTAGLGSGAFGTVAWWIFAAFAIGFAVKIPIWPFHTWLPDAHVEAPTAGSALLAGIMLKMGLYGFLRIAVPILPQAFHHWQLILGILAVVSIVYGAAVAFAQTDIKKLIAYSSVSHMGFAMLGIAAGTAAGFSGAMAVSISHGLIAAMLFLLVGVVYERTHTREIAKLSGVAAAMPRYAGLFCFASFAAMGVPLLSGFVGEFLSLLGSWGSAALPHVLVVIAGVGILLGGAYMLWLMQRFIFGTPSAAIEGQPEISARELTTIVPLAVLVVAIGVYWTLLLQYADPIARMLQKLVGA
ncbi:MAG: NADH-quinone oxidoreductase subunit M [Coriobacteriia bacterium]|nr:NADH-quinone oxidoreductase subunit M [Coriobacteriia bacterium]